MLVDTPARTYALPRRVQLECGRASVTENDFSWLIGQGPLGKGWVQKMTEKELCPDGRCPDTGWYGIEDPSNPDLLVNVVRAAAGGEYEWWTPQGWVRVDLDETDLRYLSRELAADVVATLASGCTGLLLRPGLPRAWLAAGKDWSTAAREKASEKGQALPDGSYPIRDKADLRRAVQAFGRAKDKAKVKRHIIKRARALGALDLLPDSWGVTAAAAAPPTSGGAVAYAIVDDLDPDAVLDLIRISEGPKVERYEDGAWVEDTALMASLQGVDPPALVELDDEKLAQVQEQVDAYDAEHRKPGEAVAAAGNAETLRRYWATGKGAAKIRWGTGGDFKRCVRQVRKYMPGQAEGYCAKLHRRATGKWPGRGRGHGVRGGVSWAEEPGVATSGNQIPVVDTLEELLEAVRYADTHREARWYVRRRLQSLVSGARSASWGDVMLWALAYQKLGKDTSLGQPVAAGGRRA